MKARIQTWTERAERLHPREKILVLVSGVVLLLMSWDTLVRAPLAKAIKQAQDQRTALAAEVSGFELALETLNQDAERQGDPIAAARKQIEETQAEIRKLDQQVKTLTASGVVDPPDMAKVLAEVLRLNTRLTLLGLRNLKSEPITGSAEQARLLGGGAGSTAGPATGAGSALTQVYRHSVELELRGSYLDALDYLQAVERLPWRLIWNELEIRMGTYPAARVRLVISTLSLQAGVLGV